MTPEEATKALDIERIKLIINGGYFFLLLLFGYGFFLLAKMVLIRIGDKLGEIVELLRALAGLKPPTTKPTTKENP